MTAHDSFVAFVRNVNQGQRGHPSTADLLNAFAEAGCPDAVSFQSNGTVVFAPPAPAPASAFDHVLAQVQEALAARLGKDCEVFGMPLTQLVGIVDAHASADDVGRRELTLHRCGVIDIDAPASVQEAVRRRCLLVAAGAGWTVVSNARLHESNATPVVERLTGGPATSRGFPTLMRLAARFAR